MRRTAATLPAGWTLGPYTVVAALRSGGMAALHLARRNGPAGFARPVALKVIHPHLARDPHFVRMFLDEALLSARIRHPNVVHIEELGEQDGSYFLAMEYVDGCTLADLLTQLRSLGERLPTPVAIHIACAVLAGLHAAHGLCGDSNEPLDVVHRDVSPSNIMIDRAGHVKLIDFGVARARGRAVETRAGTLKGKYAYMSPEQAVGRPLDRRSDLYSLGVVLWEALTMQRLFAADEELAVLELVRAPRLPALDELAPHLPAALVETLTRALHASPEARPQDARSLRAELLSALPEARTLDPAELSALIERVLGPSTSLRLGERVPGLITATTPAATGLGRELPARASTPPLRRRLSWQPALLSVAGLALVLGSLWLAMRPGPAASALSAPAPRSAPEPLPAPAPAALAPSLAPPPDSAAEAPAPQAAPVARRATRVRTPRATAPPTAPPPTSLRERASPGVPMVEEPDF